MKKKYDFYTVPKRQEYMRNFYKRKMKEYRELLGDKCKFCGWNEVPEVLEFAHILGTKKECSIGQIMKYSKEVVMIELEKCMLLCPTCHRVYDYKNRESRKVGVLDAPEKHEVE